MNWCPYVIGCKFGNPNKGLWEEISALDLELILAPHCNGTTIKGQGLLICNSLQEIRKSLLDELRDWR